MSLMILSSMVLMKLEILKDSTDAFMRFYAHFEVLHYKRFIETGKNLLNFTKIARLRCFLPLSKKSCGWFASYTSCLLQPYITSTTDVIRLS